MKKTSNGSGYEAAGMLIIVTSLLMIFSFGLILFVGMIDPGVSSNNPLNKLAEVGLPWSILATFIGCAVLAIGKQQYKEYLKNRHNNRQETVPNTPNDNSEVEETQQDSQSYTTRTVPCSGCGATNEIQGEFGTCEYCGTPLN